MSTRQFYIILWAFVLTSKIQKLPCLMYGYVGKDFYILPIVYMLVNVLMICLVFFILNHTRAKQKTKFICKADKFSGKILKQILMIFAAFYFLCQALILYEHIQNIFANALFDNISWVVFSLLLVACVIYLAHTEIQNIAYATELHMFLMAFSILALALLGTEHTDMSSILPFETINTSDLLSNYGKFNLWFGDWFLVLFLARKADKIKLSKTLFVYVATMLFVVGLYVIFSGIYLSYTPVQSALVGTISEQSMLTVGVGRFDWFLILFVEVGTILSCAVSVFFGTRCLSEGLPKIKTIWLECFFALGLYLLDVMYLKDVHQKELFFTGTAGVLCEAIKISIFAMLFVGAVFAKHKTRRTNEKLS